MAKTKISEFSSTPGNNTDIDGINIAEGCAPSNINNAIRELMAQLKDFQTGAAGDSYGIRVNAQTTTTSPWAWNSDSYDQQSFSALANALTVSADAGTPTDGRKTIFRFKDNGTARALTWTTGTTKSFRAISVSLPTTTVVGKTTYVGCVYNSLDSRWDVLAVAQEV